MKILNSLFGTLFYNRRKYDRLKNDEENRRNSVALGVFSLVSTVCGVIFAVLCIWLISLLFDKSATMKSGGTLETLLLIIGIFLLIVVLVELIFQFVANGLYCAILQIKLNKKAIGYVALGIWLTLIIAAIVIVAVLIF